MLYRLLLGVAMLVPVAAGALSAADDILIADFEGDTYGDWTTTGSAFGPGPAHGTLPRQMRVSGFLGTGYANSYHGRDRSTGTLTSPPLKIQRRYINFLVGGGGYAGQTCINLLVDGKVVRTATGPNRRPGGSERLRWHSWDVGSLIGKEAIIQVVDQRQGGWGHILVDHIVQSDHQATARVERELVVQHRYLHFPVRQDAPRIRLELYNGQQRLRYFQIRLTRQEPDFWMPLDVDRWRGQTLRLVTDEAGGDTRLLEAISQDETLKASGLLYHERYRPQLHFSPRRGWTNDPNGLVYWAGEYHLFFQHNPYGTRWGNMTWGHAVSRDLVHWQELGDAIHPDDLGTIFSGSAVVDRQNTSGLGSTDHPPLVAFYTSAGSHAPEPRPFSQSMAYSLDRGRTFTKYSNNPVVEHIVGNNRDPKVFWHEPTQRWIMVLYLERGRFGLLSSSNLTRWQRLADIDFPDGHECPELFELPVDGNPRDTRWVMWEAGGRHMIGRFDGRSFQAESEVLPSEWGKNCYAGQTWNNTPDGRRIFIAWMRGGRYPDMPFNQQMTFPRRLTLHRTADGIRLFAQPVREIERLRQQHHEWKDQPLEPGRNLLAGLQGELWDIDLTVVPARAKAVELGIRGQVIRYERESGAVRCQGKSVPAALADGRLRLRVLVDRTSLEIFVGGGRYVMSLCYLPDESAVPLALAAEDGAARIEQLHVWQLQSIWQNTGK